jgi:hypothetical protein
VQIQKENQMAIKYYVYEPDAQIGPNSSATGGTELYAVGCDEGVMALYPDIVKQFSAGGLAAASAPTGYDTLDALIAAHGTVSELFSGNVRKLTLTIPGFGSNVALPIVQNKFAENSTHIDGLDFIATIYAYGLSQDPPGTGLNVPIPEGELNVLLTGYAGEARQNIPQSA